MVEIYMHIFSQKWIPDGDKIDLIEKQRKHKDKIPFDRNYYHSDNSD